SASYFKDAGMPYDEVRSKSERTHEMIRRDGLLNTAVAIGEESRRGRAALVLRDNIAATVAYMMLLVQPEWPQQRVQELMHQLQTGQSRSGESEPFFIAAQILERSRTRNKERLSTIQELGLVIEA